MRRFGFAGAEVFEVVEGGGEVFGGVVEGGLDGGAQQFGVGFGAEVDDELGAVNGGIEVGGEFGHEIVSDEVDDGDLAAEICVGAEGHFEVGDFGGLFVELRLDVGGELLQHGLSLEGGGGAELHGGV